MCIVNLCDKQIVFVCSIYIVHRDFVSYFLMSTIYINCIRTNIGNCTVIINVRAELLTFLQKQFEPVIHIKMYLPFVAVVFIEQHLAY